jgi:hypothetical protein
MASSRCTVLRRFKRAARLCAESPGGRQGSRQQQLARTVPVSFSGTAAGNSAPVCAFVLFTLPSSRVDKTPEAPKSYHLVDEHLTE